MLDKSGIIHFGKWRRAAPESLGVYDKCCTVRVMSETSDCYREVDNNNCSLKTQLPLLAGCTREKSTPRVSIRNTVNVLLFCEPCWQCSTRLDLKRCTEPDVTQHNTSIWMRETVAHPSLSLPLSLSPSFYSAGFYCCKKLRSEMYWFSF